MLITSQNGFAKILVDNYARHVTPREALVMQRFCHLRRFPLVTLLFRTASRLGDGPLWWATGIFLLAFGSPSGRWAVLGEVLAIGTAVTLFMTVKHLIGRPRPCEKWLDLPCLMAPPDRFSFPSGHTMTAFSAAGVFWTMLPGSEFIFLPIALMIGLSRIFLGLHYPTDVLVGVLLGTGIGFTTAKGVQLAMEFRLSSFLRF